jgi:hypothetical protein
MNCAEGRRKDVSGAANAVRCCAQRIFFVSRRAAGGLELTLCILRSLVSQLKSEG